MSIKPVDIFRVLFGLVLVPTGLSHFILTRELALFVPLPTGAVYFVWLNGILLTLCGSGLLLNKLPRISLMVAGLTLLISACLVQLGVEFQSRDEILRQVGIANIAKFVLAALIFFLMSFTGKQN